MSWWPFKPKIVPPYPVGGRRLSTKIVKVYLCQECHEELHPCNICDTPYFCGCDKYIGRYHDAHAANKCLEVVCGSGVKPKHTYMMFGEDCCEDCEYGHDEHKSMWPGEDSLWHSKRCTCCQEKEDCYCHYHDGECLQDECWICYGLYNELGEEEYPFGDIKTFNKEGKRNCPKHGDIYANCDCDLSHPQWR